MSKKISVIMSVYKDALEYFNAAILSIHNQTYTNWELIIINDGDCENDFKYKDCISQFSDHRILYISNGENKGIPACLNQALKIATGDYIAKMDSDDISLSTRLEHQIKYFERHPEVNILGTYAITFGDRQDLLIDYNNYSKKYRSVLLFFRNSGLIHPTYMLKRQFLEDNGIVYDEHFRKAQDYRLWVECTKYSKINCLPKIEFLYRRHFSQISTSGKSSQDAYRDEIRLMQLKKLVYDSSESEKALHLRLCNRKLMKDDVDGLKKWCEKLLKENQSKMIYDPFILKGILYSESLTAIIKLRNELGFRRTCASAFKFVSLEGMSINLYNRTVFVLNLVKKRITSLLFLKKIDKLLKLTQ